MESVLVSLDAGVLRVTLNRPEKLNAFNPAVHQGLADAMTRAESDAAIRCVLVTGAGGGFCAGADLTERDIKTRGPVDLGASLDAWYNPLVRRVRALPKPCVDDAQLGPEADNIARALASGPTKSLGLIKGALYNAANNTLDAQLDLEHDLQREAARGEDYREGVSAFLEKRKPRFTCR